MNDFDFTEYIEANTIRYEASYRGGGIEIDASEYTGIEDLKMTAYQNYLGGGMLGSIQGAIEPHWHDGTKQQRTKAVELNEALKQYFHNLTNHEDDEWEAASFEQNQARPGSAY